MFSVRYDIVVRFDFEDVKGVRPVNRLRLAGARAFTVEEDQVGREANFVHHPTLDGVCGVDVVVLALFLGDAFDLGSRRGVEDGVRHLRQGFVECGLENPVSIAQIAVLLVEFLEFRVGVDRVEGWSPFGLPVLGDTKDIRHEDLVVNENSAVEIFADVFLVIRTIVFIDSVRIAIQLLSDRRPTGEWS